MKKEQHVYLDVLCNSDFRQLAWLEEFCKNIHSCITV